MAQHQSIVDPVTKVLHGTKCNLGEAYEEVKHVIYCNQRIDIQWECIWKIIGSVGSRIDIEIKKPRDCGRHRHRENAVITSGNTSSSYLNL